MTEVITIVFNIGWGLIAFSVLLSLIYMGFLLLSRKIDALEAAAFVTLIIRQIVYRIGVLLFIPSLIILIIIKLLD